MSEVYRRLGEVLPPGLRVELPFAADAKRATAWVEALPRADANATRRALLHALEALASLPLQKGAARREIAEVLRPVVLDTAVSTQRAYAGKPLPLAGDLAALPHEHAQLHLRLAHAYRMAAADLCAPSGSLPWLRGGQVGEALNRAAHHYIESMRVAWRVYAELPADAWRGLHRSYRFAEARELDRRPANDPLVPGQPSLHLAYLGTLLLAVTNPRGFSQVEQDRLWVLCEAFADRSPLRDEPSGTSVGVADDADEGPGGKAAPRQHLELVNFAAAVEAAIGAASDEEGTVVPDHGMPVKFPVDGLRKLRRALSQAAARQFSRLDAGHRVETVFGLSGLHFEASGGRDFDSFARHVLGDRIQETARASWAAGNPENSARAVRVQAEVVDQSLGGYRMRWAQDPQLRLRVGEVVGIQTGTDEEAADWMLGLLRWLRYEADGQVMAGVELLSRSAAAVALAGAGAVSRAPVRALELRPPYGGNEWLYLSAQRLPQGEALHVGREQEEIEQLLDHRPASPLNGLRLVHALGDYFLYRYAPAPGQ
jgi:hypothetical protein